MEEKLNVNTSEVYHENTNQDVLELDLLPHPVSMPPDIKKERAKTEPYNELTNQAVERSPSAKTTLARTPEELSDLQIRNDLALRTFYEKIGDGNMTSEQQRAQTMEQETERLLKDEIGQIHEVMRRHAGNPQVLALLHARSTQLEVALAELEKFWIEKRMWDMHLENGDPKKEPITQELEKIKARLAAAKERHLAALSE